MEASFEKHQPASVKNEYFGWINISGDGSYNFLDKAPQNIEKINRYVIEKWSIKDFFMELIRDKEIYLCFYVGKRAKSLTKVQKLFKEKNLIKQGCKKSSFQEDFYFKRVKSINSLCFDLIDDYYYDSMFVISHKELDEKELKEEVASLRLFNQPVELGDYFPTIDVISVITEDNIGIIYLKIHHNS